jgi:hypothetical protein
VRKTPRRLEDESHISDSEIVSQPARDKGHGLDDRVAVDFEPQRFFDRFDLR